MRSILILILIAMLSESVEAKPRFVERITDWKFVTLNGAKLGVSILTSYKIKRCVDDHGRGVCVGGDYGPLGAKEGIRTGVSIGTIPLDWLWKKAEVGKRQTWWIYPVAEIGVNIGVITRNQQRHFSPKEKE